MSIMRMAGMGGKGGGLAEVFLTLDDMLSVLLELLPDDVDVCKRIMGDIRGMSAAESPLQLSGVDLVRSILSSQDMDMASTPIVSTGMENALTVLRQRIEERADPSQLSRESTKKLSIPSVETKKSLPWIPQVGSHEKSYRLQFFLILESASSSLLGKLMAGFMMLVIAVSTVSFVMESMPMFRRHPPECEQLRALGRPLTVEACEPRPLSIFNLVETLCIIIFTVEYLARILTVHASAGPGCSGLRCTARYMLRLLNIIDVLAVLPYYIDLMMTGSSASVKMIKVLRLTRVLRLLKVAKHNPGIRMVAEVLLMSGQPLLILLFFNAILTVLFGALVYFAEGQTFSIAPEFTQPQMDLCSNETVDALFPTGVFVRKDRRLESDEVTPFRSIPYAMWWVTVTMTTVGYGDFAPTTPVGKIIGICCFYVGIIFLGLPIQVLSTNFEEVYARVMPASLEPYSPKRKTRRGRTYVNMEMWGWLPRVPGRRRQLFNLLEDPMSCRLSNYISVAMTVLIFTSTVAFILESMPQFRHVPESCDPAHLSVENCTPAPDIFFYRLEVFCIAVFTLDYVLRMLTVHAALPEECDISSRRKYSKCKITVLYFLQVLNLVDLFAILPFYVEMVGAGGGGAAVLRVLRLVRVFRLFKAPRLRKCVDMFVDVVRDALPALLIMFLLSFLMCIFFASLVVFAEGSEYSVTDFTEDYPLGVYVRPTVNGYGTMVSPFTSILYAFWWFFTTATTVGYGDDCPTTSAGRIIGAGAFYTGILLMALPITILGGSFGKFYPHWANEFKEEKAASKDGSRSSLIVPPPSVSPRSMKASIKVAAPVRVPTPNGSSPVAWGAMLARKDSLSSLQSLSVLDSTSTTQEDVQEVKAMRLVKMETLRLAHTDAADPERRLAPDVCDTPVHFLPPGSASQD
eukprot:TRINITY_DN20970_c0_g3_i1.p1 TRINITY_DN20970_c0_g3~~TRINITY_DN20970_c0_g3_i1.p1  ORF type:complete len:914 (+),score=126.69 TRINITY_DN20970_c0_g3_i1:191-2932(+)